MWKETFYNKKKLASFLIGSRPLSIRVQMYEADVSRYTNTLTRTFACQFRFVVKTKSRTVFRCRY